MLILAMEYSTDIPSVALSRDDTILCEESWDTATVSRQHFFPALSSILEKKEIDPASIDLLAVGLGPGSFSGLRISVSAARAFALPDKTEVRGVASTEALAWQFCREKHVQQIAVIGDARRERLWLACFHEDSGNLRTQTPPTLVSWEDLANRLTPGTTLVSPDWHRLGKRLLTLSLPDIALFQERAIPGARAVAALAERDLHESRPPAELQPIYLHSPTKAQPRFQ